MLSPYPEYTKQTRCNNSLNNQVNNDSQHNFLRPIISNIATPISSNHENYIFDNNAQVKYTLDMERNSVCTRNNMTDFKTPVQQNFQNNYYTTNFDNFNHANDQEINHYLTRNPVNTRRDNLEKNRNQDTQQFIKKQGGVLGNYNDIQCENTRKNKAEINSSNYIPMPRTMAIPKENI